MANNRVIKQININEATRDLVIQFRGSSSAIEAKALDFKKDDKGNIVYLLLDRLIHKPHENLFECFLNEQWENGFSISGCYVSELAAHQTQLSQLVALFSWSIKWNCRF